MLEKNQKAEIQAIEGLDKGFLGRYILKKIESSLFLTA
jgi:hypothetical protein